GIEILTVNILAIKASPEMARALETETREKLSQEADQAVYERRNFAVEQERKIKETELNTEIAVEEKKKQIDEKKMEAEIQKAQAKFYIERSGGNFRDYEIEHQNFHNSLSLVQRQLSKVIKNKIVERNFLPSFLFNEKQVVIVIGQDGLVANTAKYVNEIPIV